MREKAKREKEAEAVLEAARKADRKTQLEQWIGTLLVAGGVTVVLDQFILAFLPWILAIPLLVSGVPITIYALFENKRKFREYAEENLGEVRKNEKL